MELLVALDKQEVSCLILLNLSVAFDSQSQTPLKSHEVLIWL